MADGLLAVDLIRRDGGTQMRVSLNDEAVSAYAERMEAGDKFPAVVVFYDGTTYWLADGFHRVAARQQLVARTLGTRDASQWSMVEIDLRPGRREDAVRFAISANRKNGLRRTNADKQVAVRAALAHPDMQGMSDQAIADEAGVSRATVQNYRQAANLATSTQAPVIQAKTARTGTDGKQYPVRPPHAPARKRSNESRNRERDAAATKRAAAANKPKPPRTCPTCCGKGYLND